MAPISFDIDYVLYYFTWHMGKNRKDERKNAGWISSYDSTKNEAKPGDE